MKNLLKVLVLLTFLSSSLLADLRDTAAGTLLFSTNTKMIFSNNAGFVYTNFGTNNLSDIVKAIYGFTNMGSTYVGTTTTNFPNQPAWYYYNWTNEGNTNVTYNLDFVSTIITNYDGLAPADSSGTWTVEINSLADSNANLFGSAFPASATTNIGDDDGFGYYVKIAPPVDAINGTGYKLYLTNQFTDPLGNGAYTGTNAFAYGGSNFFADEIDFVIKAPDLKVYKSMAVTNQTGVSGTGIDEQSVIPGSIITYTIHYTNKGDAAAEGLFFEEYLPNLLTESVRYVDYVPGSMVYTGTPALTLAGNTFYSTDAGSSFVDHTTLSPSADEGIVNTSIDAFRWQFTGSLAAKRGGTITYKVVVR